MPISTEERVAVLESLSERNERDKGELFRLFREHMEKEEEDRVSLLVMISNSDKKIDVMKAYFIGGAVVLSAIWAVTTFFLK